MVTRFGVCALLVLLLTPIGRPGQARAAGGPTWHAHVRSFYFYRDQASGRKREAWALGGDLEAAATLWRDRIAVAASLYTSQPLYAPEGREGTLLLAPGQEGFSVLGRAWLELRPVAGLATRLYRQTFDLPFLNRQDNRMVPNTFEGAALYGESIGGAEWTLAWLTAMKKRNADTFVSVGAAAGVPAADGGLGALALDLPLGEGLLAHASLYRVEDYLDTWYTRADWSVPLEGAGLDLSVQYTHQDDTGRALGGPLDARVAGLRLDLDAGPWHLALAHNRNWGGGDLVSPYGTRPTYINLVEFFDRAGERAWMGILRYAFPAHLLPGTSAQVNYAVGDTPDTGPRASPDQSELNLILAQDFAPLGVPGLTLKLRLSRIRHDADVAGADSYDDARLVLDYRIPL